MVNILNNIKEEFPSVDGRIFFKENRGLSHEQLHSKIKNAKFFNLYFLTANLTILLPLKLIKWL